MTYDEFFEKLPRDGWQLIGSAIRREPNECPISAVAGSSSVRWWKFTESLGIDYGMGERIAVTADGRSSLRQYDPALRARLLAHCGLKEHPMTTTDLNGREK